MDVQVEHGATAALGVHHPAVPRPDRAGGAAGELRLHQLAVLARATACLAGRRTRARSAGIGRRSSSSLGGLGRVDHAGGLGGRERHRLLGDHVLAGLGAADGHLGVQVGGQADVDQVDVGLGDQVLAVGEHLVLGHVHARQRHLEVALHVRPAGAARGVGVGDGNDLGAGHVLVVGQMRPAHEAQADHSDLDGIFHFDLAFEDDVDGAGAAVDGGVGIEAGGEVLHHRVTVVAGRGKARPSRPVVHVALEQLDEPVERARGGAVVLEVHGLDALAEDAIHCCG